MRLRNQFVYYGAHTGRWSGRGFQPHNLTRAESDQPTGAAKSSVKKFSVIREMAS
jgi:hypothetical protein